MPIMPGALWRPLATNYATAEPRLTRVDIACIHTMVGSLNGTDNYFRVSNGPGYSGTESHFGVGGDGTKVQWQDTDFQADANLDGGLTVVSIENADTGAPFPAWSGSDVPAFTAEQVESNAQILAWLHQTEDLPLELVPDTLPGRRGVAYHRQGIDPWRVTGGVRWSGATGKVCPGDRRIAQIALIISRARQLAGLTPPPVPATPKPPVVAAPKPPVNPPAPAVRPTVRQGDGPGAPLGGHVKVLQSTLRNDYPLYGKGLVVDGDFGPATDRVVREFQGRSGLAADGVVGPRTWKALGL